MAKSNYREYLKCELVKAKKYFYVIRPLLACKWILDRNSPPPMLFSELKEAELDPAIKPEVDRLLDLKMNSPELKLIPRVNVLNEYMDACILEIERKLEQMKDGPRNDWDELNRIFYEVIGYYPEKGGIM